MGPRIVKKWLTLCLSFLVLSSANTALATSETTIDVLALYTDGVAARYGEGVQSRLNQVISVSNKVFADSNLNVKLRLVHQQQVDYSDSAHPQNAIYAMTCDLNKLQTQNTCDREASFQSVDSLRAQYGADMVVLVRPYSSSHGGVCGIAWIGGQNTNGDLSHKIWRETAMSAIGLDGPCGDWVTAHELGHNMGLTHSALQDNSGGTFPWAWGHGESNNFSTIMGYAWMFGRDTRKAYNFSSPSLDCFGSPCGIDRNSYGGADSVHTLSVTAPQIAAYTDSVVVQDEGGNEPVDNTDDAVSELEKLKQQWIAAKQELADLKAIRDVKRDAKLAALVAFRVVQRDYTSAYRDYRSNLNRLYTLHAKAVAAINQYNASGGQSATAQQRLYNTAVYHINQFNNQIPVVNAAVAKVNAKAAAYNSANQGYKQALLAFEEAQQDVVVQMERVEQAYQNFRIATNANQG